LEVSELEKWQELAELFLLNQKAQGLASRTVNDSEYHIKQFFDRTSPGSVDDLKMAVLKYFANNEISAYTHNTRRKKLRIFFQWMIEEGLITVNPMATIKKRKEDLQPRPATEDSIKRLFELPDRRTFIGVRDYALILLSLDCGIRPGEALQLFSENIDLRSMQVEIPAAIAKTRISRTLPIMPQTAEALRKLMMARHADWKNVPLFCNQDGGKFTGRGWAHRLEAYSRELGVKVTPYQLRHSFGTFYLRSGGTDQGLQRMMGHETGEMARRYVLLLRSDIKREHESASPVARLLPQRKRVRTVRGE
jgi:site-specific recombinase XerD